MGKWFLLTLVVVAVGLSVGTITALRSPRFTERAARFALNKYWPQGQVRSLHIGKQFLHWPELAFEDVRLEARIAQKGKEPVPVQADLVRFTVFVTSKKEIRLEGKGLNLSSGPHHARDVDFLVNLRRGGRGLERIAGWARAAEAGSGQFNLSGISANIQGTDRTVHLLDFTALAYGGRLAGEISLEYTPRLAYGIQMHFQGISCERLREYQPGVFQSLLGNIDGALRLAGEGERVRSLEADAAMPGGGEVRAALLGFFAQYIPTQERRTLETLARSGGMLAVEKATVEARTVDNRHLSGLIHLESRQLKLNFNIPMDVNFDGNIWSLLQLGR